MSSLRTIRILQNMETASRGHAQRGLKDFLVSMPVEVIFGSGDGEKIFFSDELAHCEQDIRYFVSDAGFPAIARIVAVVAGYEIPIRGSASNLLYRAYVSPASPCSSSSILNADSHMNGIGEDQEEEEEPPEPSSSNILNDIQGSSTQVAPSIIHKSPIEVTHSRQTRTSDQTIRRFDIITNMKSSPTGREILARMELSSIKSDKLWRPRLVKYVGRQLIRTSVSDMYPTRKEMESMLIQFVDAGYDIGSLDDYTDAGNGYLARHLINKRRYLRRNGEMSPVKQKRNDETFTLDGAAPDILNERMQTVQNGTNESIQLMDRTRSWRIAEGRKDLSTAIISCRQIIDWPSMVIKDAESIFPVSLQAFTNSYQTIGRLLYLGTMELLPSPQLESLPKEEDQSLRASIQRSISLLNSVSGRSKKANIMSHFYSEFEEGTMSDILMSLSSKRSGKRGKRKNDEVSPSLFRYNATFFLNVCGREVNIGTDEIRGLFALVSYFMVFDLRYDQDSSDLFCLFELFLGFPRRKTMAKTSCTLFDRLREIPV